MSSNNNNYPPSLYVGSAKLMQRDGKSDWLKIELDLTELEQKQTDDHLRTWTSKKDGVTHRVITLICAEMKPENKTEYKTHSLKIDTFKPDPSKRKSGRVESSRGDAVGKVQEMFAPDSVEDDVPF